LKLGIARSFLVRQLWEEPKNFTCAGLSMLTAGQRLRRFGRLKKGKFVVGIKAVRSVEIRSYQVYLTNERNLIPSYYSSSSFPLQNHAA
jgi:hypothetical protein